MCGITGCIRFGDQNILTEITNTMIHRGPDDFGVKWFDKFSSGIGHRRLSIIDTSYAGHQPMANKQQNLWITFNGEIYNYKEIRSDLEGNGFVFKTNSDTEVLLAAYEKWGLGCLGKLNGMFAFAIFNTIDGSLFAARDRFGVKPMYYSSHGNSLVFASEIKSILASKFTDPDIDLFAMTTPTRFQLAPYTGFKNIFKLPPAHYLTFKDGDLKIEPYWMISIGDNTPSDRSILENLGNLLNDSVRLQMIADVKVGILLGGGLDSSILSALMRKNTNQDIHSFTIKFSKQDQKFEKAEDDFKFARIVANQFNLQSHEIELNPDIVNLLPQVIWHLDEPLADPAAINTYLISKVARNENIKVLLNGTGGDEIFDGYRKYYACLLAENYKYFTPLSIDKYLRQITNKFPLIKKEKGLKTIRWIRRFLSFASKESIERFLNSDLSFNRDQFNQLFSNKINYEESFFYKNQSKFFHMPNIPYLHQMCLCDTRGYLPEHNLLYSDKASMMASVEARPPLTDHRIVELMFSLSSKYKIRRGTQKFILKKFSEKYLPKNIIYRKKEAFAAPIRSWIKGPLREMIDDLLSFEAIKKRGLYNPDFARKIIDNDRKGTEDNFILIWVLLTNELWFRGFIDHNNQKSSTKLSHVC